jgi:imidazole glycerol-phosphate synthase subunit HisH
MIVVIDYGMGNLGSILNMLKKVGAQARISSDSAVIGAADKLILPGVGAFDAGMRRLHELNLVETLTRRVTREHTPFLGVCLGMQLLTQGSEEGDLPGLGWIEGRTLRFAFGQEHCGLKVPHMGWNTVSCRKEAPLFAGLEPDSRFYFVHSYYVMCARREDVLATTTHGVEFDSAVSRGNIMGTQFHPEKSHRFGMAVLANFVERS